MHDATAGRFCWVDLTATDASRAIGFYGELFGWSASEQAANGGTFVRLTHEGREIGSLYQLRRDVGLSSHWTPYVRVQSAAGTCDRVVALGGRVAVAPFEVDGVARIALVVDPTGASFGLWEEIA